ncbi:MAG: sel1 repeat family protein [Acidobacteria bacterium]|nr:sel1 repeat family protein [Acidobacteriota bacterium]
MVLKQAFPHVGLAILALFFIPVLTFAQSTTEDASKFTELLKRAFDGDAGAMNEVGIAYAEGIGTKPDQKKAVVWFQRAAELGDAHGAGNMGLHSLNGAGVTRDKMQAAKWFIICHSLDGLRCFPDDFVGQLKLSKKQYRIAWKTAEDWLRARPDLKNNHGERPWFGKNDYPPDFEPNPKDRP